MDNEHGDSGAADQNENTSENLDKGTQDGTNTEGNENGGNSDNSSDDEGADHGDDGNDGEGGDKKPTPYESQKRRAELAEADAKIYKQKLIDAGILDKDGKEKKPAPKDKEASPTDENAVRARLEARGVLDEDAQNEVLEAARMLGITPLEALNRPLVIARLAEIKADKAAKNATPPPRNGGGKTPSTTNVGVLADKVEKGGDLPTDPALAEKVQQELARRAQNRR